MAVLYQVEQQGRQTAFVGEDGTGLVGLYPLLARAAAITENENNSFAEALSLAAAERGTPLRRVFADEAEALSHDLGPVSYTHLRYRQVRVHTLPACPG